NVMTTEMIVARTGEPVDSRSRAFQAICRANPIPARVTRSNMMIRVNMSDEFADVGDATRQAADSARRTRELQPSPDGRVGCGKLLDVIEYPPASLSAPVASAPPNRFA